MAKERKPSGKQKQQQAQTQKQTNPRTKTVDGHKFKRDPKDGKYYAIIDGERVELDDYGYYYGGSDEVQSSGNPDTSTDKTVIVEASSNPEQLMFVEESDEQNIEIPGGDTDLFQEFPSSEEQTIVRRKARTNDGQGNVSSNDTVDGAYEQQYSPNGPSDIYFEKYNYGAGTTSIFKYDEYTNSYQIDDDGDDIDFITIDGEDFYLHRYIYSKDIIITDDGTLLRYNGTNYEYNEDTNSFLDEHDGIIWGEIYFSAAGGAWFKTKNPFGIEKKQSKDESEEQNSEDQKHESSEVEVVADDAAPDSINEANPEKPVYNILSKETKNKLNNALRDYADVVNPDHELENLINEEYFNGKRSTPQILADIYHKSNKDKQKEKEEPTVEEQKEEVKQDDEQLKKDIKKLEELFNKYMDALNALDKLKKQANAMITNMYTLAQELQGLYPYEHKGYEKWGVYQEMQNPKTGKKNDKYDAKLDKSRNELKKELSKQWEEFFKDYIYAELAQNKNNANYLIVCAQLAIYNEDHNMYLYLGDSYKDPTSKEEIRKAVLAKVMGEDGKSGVDGTKIAAARAKVTDTFNAYSELAAKNQQAEEALKEKKTKLYKTIYDDKKRLEGEFEWDEELITKYQNEYAYAAELASAATKNNSEDKDDLIKQREIAYKRLTKQIEKFNDTSLKLINVRQKIKELALVDEENEANNGVLSDVIPEYDAAKNVEEAFDDAYREAAEKYVNSPTYQYRPSGVNATLNNTKRLLEDTITLASGLGIFGVVSEGALGVMPDVIIDSATYLTGAVISYFLEFGTSWGTQFAGIPAYYGTRVAYWTAELTKNPMEPWKALDRDLEVYQKNKQIEREKKVLQDQQNKALEWYNNLTNGYDNIAADWQKWGNEYGKFVEMGPKIVEEKLHEWIGKFMNKIYEWCGTKYGDFHDGMFNAIDKGAKGTAQAPAAIANALVYSASKKLYDNVQKNKAINKAGVYTKNAKFALQLKALLG